MACQTKVRKIGNSPGIVLPKEALQDLQVQPIAFRIEG